MGTAGATPRSDLHGPDASGVPATGHTGGANRGRNFAFAGGGVIFVLILVAAAFLVLDHNDNSNALIVNLEALDARPAGAFTASTVNVDTKAASSFAATHHSSPATTSTTTPGAATTTTPHASPSEGFNPATVTGDRTGLYGTSTTRPVCDTTRLAKLLGANTAKRTAWAKAMGTTLTAVPATIRALTPVLLTRDTAATEHVDSSSDQHRTRQVILQSGTAVLLDTNATPRVRCASGTPLNQAKIPGSTRPTFAGAHWTGFDPGHAVTVDPTHDPVTTITSIDITTGKPTITGLGDTETLDGYLVTNNQGVSVVSRDGKQKTRVIDHPVAEAFDDGQGGIIYQDKASSDDSADTSKIMRLPPNATQPVELETAKPGHLIQLLDVASYHDVLTMLFSESIAPPSTATSGTMPTITTLHLIDLTAKQDHPITMNAPADNPQKFQANVYSGSLGGERVALNMGPADAYWMYFGEPASRTGPDSPWMCYSGSTDVCQGATGVVLPDGTLATVNATLPGQAVTVNVYAPEKDKITRTLRVHDFDAHSCGRYTIEHSDNAAIVSCISGPGADPQHAVEIDTKTWQTKVLPINGHVIPLDAPIIRPKATTSTGGTSSTSTARATPRAAPTTKVAPTTTQPPRTAPTWDQIKNASIPAECTHPATTLVDGKNVTLGSDGPPGTRGIYEFQQQHLIQGLPSDAGPLTVVGVVCNAGGVGWPEELVAFSSGGRFYDEIAMAGHGPGTWDEYQSDDSSYYESSDLWTNAGLAGPARATFDSYALEGNHIRLQIGALLPGECEACSTGSAYATVSASGGKLHIDSVERTDPPN